MGIYYSAPLLGPSLGPILGGVLTQAFSWRATFWFLAAFVGACFLSFLPFRDTFRRERSLTYQAALRHRRRALLAASTRASAASSVTQVAAVSRAVSPHPPPALPPAEDEIERRAVEHVSVREPARDRDVEKQEATADAVVAPMEDIKLSLADVNPVKPIVYVLRRLNNLTILIASGTPYPHQAVSRIS